MKNKKTIIIIVSIIIFLLLGIALYFIFANKEKEIISGPVHQPSIPTTNTKVQINLGKSVVNRGNYEVFRVEPKFKLEIVKNLALNSGFKLVTSDEDVYYMWRRENDLISYDVISNKLAFSGNNIFTLQTIDENLFSEMAKKYFEEDWQYNVSSEEGKTGEITYIAYRKLGESLHVESRENKNETDKIVVENGKIISGSLTLTSFQGTGEYLPLLSKEELSKYINQSEYPKEILPSYETLNSVMDLAYKQGYEDIYKTLENCSVDKISIVYYYKNITQEVLTPVYKAISICQVEYEKKKYEIPATIFVSAIEPSHILTD